VPVPDEGPLVGVVMSHVGVIFPTSSRTLRNEPRRIAAPVHGVPSRRWFQESCETHRCDDADGTRRSPSRLWHRAPRRDWWHRDGHNRQCGARPGRDVLATAAGCDRASESVLFGKLEALDPMRLPGKVPPDAADNGLNKPLLRVIARVLRLASAGVLSKVMRTTRSICASLTRRGAPGRASSSEPATPGSAGAICRRSGE
jgi:hypothetical protein